MRWRRKLPTAFPAEVDRPSLHPGRACLLGEPSRWVTRMDEGDGRQRQGGRHGDDTRDGTDNSHAMVGSAYGGMENGERTCAPRPARFIASYTDTAVIGWLHGTGG